MYLDPSQACVDAVILELNLFGQHSGCKPNISKTKCIPLGATRDNTSLRNYLTSTYGEDMVANEFTALGVKFDNTSSGADLCKMNYHSKLSNASSAINTWSKRDLTLIGKCTIIKSLILSQFTYLIIPLETPDTNTISKIDTMIFHFLWGCKRDKFSIQPRCYASPCVGPRPGSVCRATPALTTLSPLAVVHRAAWPPRRPTTPTHRAITS